MDDGSDRVISRFQKKETRSSASLWFVAAVATLMVFGAGCAKASQPITLQPTFQQNAATNAATVVNTLIPAPAELDINERSACFDGSGQMGNWKTSDLYRYITTHFSNGGGELLSEDFNKVLQNKIDNGWRISILCVTEGPIFNLGYPSESIYFAMYQILYNDETKKTYPPETRAEFTLLSGTRGTPNIIGSMSPERGGKVIFSKPFNINGIVDTGMITELSHDLALGPADKVYAKTGGGEAEGSWTAVLQFDTKTGTVKILKELSSSENN